MDISIKPVFSFSLNYKVFEKLVTCGKYDGIHSCLTVVTNADKVRRRIPVCGSVKCMKKKLVTFECFEWDCLWPVCPNLQSWSRLDSIECCCWSLVFFFFNSQILIHTPHKRYGLQNSKLSISEIKNDIAMLNMNFPIRAIIAGKLKRDDDRDILVIGSSSHFLGMFWLTYGRAVPTTMGLFQQLTMWMKITICFNVISTKVFDRYWLVRLVTFRAIRW